MNNQNSAPSYDPTAAPIMDSIAIQALLPHRYPFLLVDKVVALSENSITAIKNVTHNEPFFQGHFPGNPVMPGVLQVEALVQAGGILALRSVPSSDAYWTYFLGIDHCRFRKIVAPGDTLLLRCTLEGEIRRGVAKLMGQAFVGGKLVCNATMTAMVVKKNNI